MLTTGSGTHVAKRGIFLLIAVMRVSDFILVTNKYGITLMNANQDNKVSWKAFFVRSYDI